MVPIFELMEVCLVHIARSTLEQPLKVVTAYTLFINIQKCVQLFLCPLVLCVLVCDYCATVCETKNCMYCFVMTD